MTALLEILLTFVGVMLLLALVTQSLLEITKTAFPLESMTRKGSTRRLLEESAVASGLDRGAGEQIFEAVERRLRGLGQNGWQSVRLDSLNAEDLEGLVLSLGDDEVEAVRTCDDPRGALKAVGGRARDWFALAMNPVSDRYGRRMRVANVVAAALVVWFLKVDAIDLMERARTDPDFREAVMARATTADSLLQESSALSSRLDRLLDSVRVAGGDTAVGPPPVDAQASIDSLRARLGEVTDGLDDVARGATGLFDTDRSLDLTTARGLGGFLLSVLLISLGAPFWNDLLGSLFGVKNRIQAEARRMKQETAETRANVPDRAARSG